MGAQRLCAAILFLCGSTSLAHADATLLLATPYGRAGSINPTGHVGVYLSRVCAATPTVLRRCANGESGVVIARYNKVAGFDWMAIPLMPYLYAVERAADVPAFATPEKVFSLRDEYRRAHLRDIVPDALAASEPAGRWSQLVGAVYDRQIIAFPFTTTPAQDDELIARLNGQENQRRYHLLFRNCADFVREILNFYHPGAIRRNVVADLGLTTPKQIVKSLLRHGARHPEVLSSAAFRIPQIPGSRHESRPVRGLLEFALKSKKYAIPLALAHPLVPVGLAAGYLATGRFNPLRHATLTYEPADVERHAQRTVDQTSLDSSSMAPQGSSPGSAAINAVVASP